MKQQDRINTLHVLCTVRNKCIINALKTSVSLSVKIATRRANAQTHANAKLQKMYQLCLFFRFQKVLQKRRKEWTEAIKNIKVLC